jgi:hypothetical protein
MKIFLSWSGDQSHSFAEELRPWLEEVLLGTEICCPAKISISDHLVYRDHR